MAFALGVLASISPAQTNYIHNGDFSAPVTLTTRMFLLSNGTDWAASTNTIVTRDEVNGHNAPGCLRIKADTVGDAKSKRNRVIAPITINGGEALAMGATRMQLRFWVRSDRAGGGNSTVFARCESFLNHAPWTMTTGGFKTYPKYNRGAGTCDTEWRECVMDDIPVVDGNVYNFHFLINDTNSVLLVDDITFMISATRLPETADAAAQPADPKPPRPGNAK